MIAVLTGKAPRFPQVDYYLSLPASPTSQPTPIHESPLSGDGDFENIITDCEDADLIIQLLKQMWILTLDHRLLTLAEESMTSRPQISFSVEPQHNYSTHLLTLPLLPSSADSTHNHVLETLSHASTIYSLVLTSLLTPQQIDFPSLYLTPTFHALTTSFSESSTSNFWVRYPGIQLWVLLVGTAASRGKKEAAFWMFYLSRTGSFSNAGNWLTGNAAIRLFLDVQRRMRECDGGGTE